MDLLQLPREVLEDHILPHLKWNDLLRLRRVSKEFKDAIGVYVNKHPELAPEIEIRKEGSHGRTLKHFLELGIPSQKFYLNNKSGNGETFYKTNYVFKGRFLEQFGSKITHLRVQNFNLHCAKEEREFLEKLTNLRSFIAEQVNLKIIKVTFPAAPSVFQNLKTLILTGLTSNPREYDVTQSLHQFLVACKSLELLSIPVVPNCNADYMSKVFQVLESHIKMRSKAAEKGDGTALKAVNFVNLPNLDNSGSSVEAYRAWGNLAKTCVAESIKMGNCRCAWFQEGVVFSILGQNLGLNLGTTVVSLACQDFPEALWLMDMPNLESLKVESTSKLATALGNRRQYTGQYTCPNWPRLKSLDVTMSSSCNSRNMKYVYQFLFRGLLHQNLKELTLQMAYYKEIILHGLINHLIVSCPNLSKLTLVNWPRDSKAVTRIWEGFPRLEELILDNCALTDGFFLGRDQENPTFLKLRSLKKLTLKNLKKVGITERVFSDVICHMHLTHLTLTAERVYCQSYQETGNDSVDNYLAPGLQSLVGGPFAESIEVLKLEGKFVPSVNPIKFQSILNKFRSSNM